MFTRKDDLELLKRLDGKHEDSMTSEDWFLLKRLSGDGVRARVNNDGVLEVDWRTVQEDD